MMGAFETQLSMASITIHCSRCHSKCIYRHDKTPAGHVHYCCFACHHIFQPTYTYEARKLGFKEKIVEMAFNSSGVRETSHVLNIGINTILYILKNSRQGK